MKKGEKREEEKENREEKDVKKKEINNYEDIEKINKRQVKEENEQFKKIFFVIGILVLIFIGVILFINSVRHFKYKGIDFDVVKEGDLILYRTLLPVKLTNPATGQVVSSDYNLYFRNDPRKLEEEVLFDGKLNLKENMIMNFTENFNCDGDGVIAVANLLNLLSLMKVNVIKNESLGCNKESKYSFVQLQSGNETEIEQFHTNCYNLNINSCEILEVTERYMLEVIVRVKEASEE